MMTRIRRTRAVPLAVGAVLALLATGCGVSLQALPKPNTVSGPTYTINAVFANVVNLPATAEVRIGAFTTGYVSALRAENFKAIVTMHIKQSQKLLKGTTAQIRFDTPLGEDYISLVQPQAVAAGGIPVVKADTAPGYLSNGATIAETDTATAPSVEDVFAALGLLLNNGGLNQLQTIITELNNAFRGNAPEIHNLIGQLNTTLTSFATHVPDLTAALTQIGDLSSELNSNSGTIVAGINALAPAVTTLRQNSQSLTNLVNQIGNLADVANNVVTQSQQGLMTTLRALSPVLDQLTAVQGQLGPALNAIDALEVRTPSIAPGNYVQVALHTTVQLPPVPAGALALQKVTVDPPDPNESYARSGIATMLEGGLP